MWQRFIDDSFCRAQFELEEQSKKNKKKIYIYIYKQDKQVAFYA